MQGKIFDIFISENWRTVEKYKEELINLVENISSLQIIL